MAHASARAQMALAFETVYGTPPVSGYTRVPFSSTTFGSEQPLIGSSCSATAAIRPRRSRMRTADGDAVVPIDAPPSAPG